MFIVRVFTPPNPKGFVNGFTEYLRATTGSAVADLSREQTAALSWPNIYGAEAAAAWATREFPDRAVTVEVAGQ